MRKRRRDCHAVSGPVLDPPACLNPITVGQPGQPIEICLSRTIWRLRVIDVLKPFTNQNAIKIKLLGYVNEYQSPIASNRYWRRVGSTFVWTAAGYIVNLLCRLRDQAGRKSKARRERA